MKERGHSQIQEKDRKNYEGIKCSLVQWGSRVSEAKCFDREIVRGGQKLNYIRPFGLRNLGFILMWGH